MRNLTITFASFVFVFMSMNAKAQEESQQNIVITSQPANDDEVTLTNGLYVDHLRYHNGWGVGVNLIFLDMCGAIATARFEDLEDVRDRYGWNISIGMDHRFCIGKIFFLEFGAGIGWKVYNYEYSSIEETEYYSKDLGGYTTIKKWYEEREGNGFMYFTPRFGFKILNIRDYEFLCVSAGYRFDYLDYEFSKSNLANYFTIGLSYNFEYYKSRVPK